MRKLHANHEQCWEMIPWVVNGRASDAEQQTVLAHVEQCSECQEELARHRELHSHMRGNEDVIAAPNASWQKLLTKIDEQATAEAASAKTYRMKRPWLIAALWLQLVAIAVLTGALFGSTQFGSTQFGSTQFRSTPSSEPEYVTLSNSPPQTPDRSAAVRVVFSPTAQLNDINQLLRSVECEILSGPSEAGVYTLAAEQGKDVSAIIATLRKHSDVLFAEPSLTAAGSPR